MVCFSCGICQDTCKSQKKQLKDLTWKLQGLVSTSDFPSQSEIMGHETSFKGCIHTVDVAVNIWEWELLYSDYISMFILDCYLLVS